jgi:CRISPR/Cas system-associated exonuclease Cas4 (RecB family)
MIAKAQSNERKYDFFHPSAWGSCLRCIAYQFYNQQHGFLKKHNSVIDQRMERIFDNGHGMHLRWQEYLAASRILRGCWTCTICGIVYGRDALLGILSPTVTEGPNWTCACGSKKELKYQEVLVSSEPRYNFEGHVDAIVDLRGTEFQQGNECDVFVLDFKSIKDDYFSELRHAKHEHVVQIHIYMWLLDLKAAVVLYENKDDQNVKEMFVPRDEALVARIKEESLWLVEVLKHGKLPPRPTGHSRSKIPCRFCDFQELCYA